MDIFNNLMTITLEVNMKTKQMTYFSNLLCQLYPLAYFIFAFQQDGQNSVSSDPFVALSSGL